jgi:hypothetical protein
MPNHGHKNFMSTVDLSNKLYCISELEFEEFSVSQSKWNVCLVNACAISLASALAECKDLAFASATLSEL